jgi:hypothetical protein
LWEEFFENGFVQTFPSFLLGHHFGFFHFYRFFVDHLLPHHNVPTPEQFHIARWWDSSLRKGGVLRVLWRPNSGSISNLLSGRAVSEDETNTEPPSIVPAKSELAEFRMNGGNRLPECLSASFPQADVLARVVESLFLRIASRWTVTRPEIRGSFHNLLGGVRL